MILTPAVIPKMKMHPLWSLIKLHIPTVHLLFGHTMSVKRALKKERLAHALCHCPLIALHLADPNALVAAGALTTTLDREHFWTV